MSTERNSQLQNSQI